MKKIRIKTEKLELEAQDVSPWLAFAVLVSGVVLVLSGVWVWA